jgi:hypothetical protein
VTERKIDGRTKRAADMALAKKQISKESYEAILRGEIVLAEAKKLGREGAPYTPTTRGSVAATEGPERAGAEHSSEQRPQAGTGALPTCLCGCGAPVKNRFRAGHDQRLFGELKRNLEKNPLLRNERYDDEQKAYAKERGLV